MKKLFLLLMISALSMFSHQMNAQKMEIQGRIGPDLALDDNVFNSGGSFDVLFGYRVAPLLRVGGGIGFQQIDFVKAKEAGTQWEEKAQNIPVFADVKFNLTNSKFSPFVNAQAGIIENGKHSGKKHGEIDMDLIVKVGVGCDINFDNGTLFFEIGYKRLNIKSTSIEFDHLDGNPSFIGLSAGYIIKL